MTTGPDNLGNGAPKTEDRFGGQLGYRPRANRDGGALPAGSLSAGSLSAGPVNAGPLNGSPLGGGPLDAAGTALSNPLDIANPIASTLTQPTLGEPEPRDPGYRERSSLAADSWLAPSGQGAVDHPLLRGLLLELPPKGATLQSQWLDRWFEAARAILELLYRFEDKRD